MTNQEMENIISKVIPLFKAFQDEVKALQERVRTLENRLDNAPTGREKRRKRDYETWKRVQELLKTGMSARMAAAQLGLPQATVYKYKATSEEEAIALSQSEEQSE